MSFFCVLFKSKMCLKIWKWICHGCERVCNFSMIFILLLNLYFISSYMFDVQGLINYIIRIEFSTCLRMILNIISSIIQVPLHCFSFTIISLFFTFFFEFSLISISYISTMTREIGDFFFYIRFGWGIFKC